LKLNNGNGIPTLTVVADDSKPIRSIDVFYTQHSKPNETPSDRDITMHRFWRHAKTQPADGQWIAELPIFSTDKPLWAYANVSYELEEPVSGAGYYYRTYTATNFNLSSLLKTASPEKLQASGVKATLKPTNTIETFQGGWEKEWFTYKPDQWARSTHKLYDDQYKAPGAAKLVLDVQSDQTNKLVILLDDYAAEVSLRGEAEWQQLILSSDDFQNYGGESIPSWNTAKRLTLSAAERLRPGRGQQGEPRIVGKNWRGEPPRFRNLRWLNSPSQR
jgi:hypothetical protein